MTAYRRFCARFGVPMTVAAALAAGPAAAQETEHWGTARGWDVRVDSTLGNGCFILAGFEDGTVFRLGFDRTDDSAYMMVGNDDWGSIGEGKDYELEIRMDRASPWSAPATGVRIDGSPFLYIPLDEADFVEEFMRKHTLAIDHDGDEVVRLSLEGSSAAIVEMVECQDKVDRGVDPFKN